MKSVCKHGRSNCGKVKLFRESETHSNHHSQFQLICSPNIIFYMKNTFIMISTYAFFVWLSFCGFAIFIKNFTIDTNSNVACLCVFYFLPLTSINYEYWLSKAVSSSGVIISLIWFTSGRNDEFERCLKWFIDQCRNHVLRLTLKFLLSYQYSKLLNSFVIAIK